jgi:hypothetical protein
MGKGKRTRRYTAGKTRQHGMKFAVGRIRLRCPFIFDNGDGPAANLSRREAELFTVARGMGGTRQSGRIGAGLIRGYWRGLHLYHLWAEHWVSLFGGKRRSVFRPDIEQARCSFDHSFAPLE